MAGLDQTVEALAGAGRSAGFAASHDHLTGLPDRASFDEWANRLGAVDGQDRAVLLLDLNEFKMVNDTYGHHAGDDLLKVIADRLRRCVRPDDLVARLGGDEFSVLLVNASTADAVAVAHHLMGDVAQQALIAGRTLRPSASVGIATGRDKPFKTRCCATRTRRCMRPSAVTRAFTLAGRARVNR